MQQLLLHPSNTVRCSDCSGSGKRRFGRGMWLNGVWTGQSGKCYRCAGKGFQTPEDQRRNAAYDNLNGARERS